MKKQTVVNVLKEHIQDAIEKTVVDNHYESGYKQCLIDIQNKIDDGLLQMEKEQIVNAYWDGGQDVPMHISTCENYYNKTFGVETGIIVFDNIHLTNTNKINNGGNNE